MENSSVAYFPYASITVPVILTKRSETSSAETAAVVSVGSQTDSDVAFVALDNYADSAISVGDAFVDAVLSDTLEKGSDDEQVLVPAAEELERKIAECCPESGKATSRFWGVSALWGGKP